MPRLRHLPRTVLTLTVAFGATLIASGVVIVTSRIRPHSDLIEKTARAWSRTWMVTAGVDLAVMGSENVDPQRSYVVVANHESNLDIMACFLAIPLPIRFLAKRELFRVPILASAMRAIGIVEVDRQARLAVHEQVNSQARQLVAAGRSVIVYPEGTRTRHGNLGPFKKGAFTMAIATQLPILPVTIRGTRGIWPPGSWLIRSGSITVAIDPAVETSGLNRASTDQLRDDVHAVIEKRLELLAQS